MVTSLALGIAAALANIPRLSMRTVAMPSAASPSASIRYGAPLTPIGLFPSRSVGPEPGMMTIVALGFEAGMTRMPLSGPAGPGASTGLTAGAAVATAAAARSEATMFMTVSLFWYLGKYRTNETASSPRVGEQAVD